MTNHHVTHDITTVSERSQSGRLCRFLMCIEWEPRLEEFGKVAAQYAGSGHADEFVPMNPSPECENDGPFGVDVSERVGVGKRAGAVGSAYFI